MERQLDDLKAETEAAIAAAGDLRALDEVRVAALGKKGRVTELVKGLGGADPAERPRLGQLFNALKRDLETALARRKGALEEAALESRLAAETLDVTLPPRERFAGSIHPVSQVTDEITAIFAEMGFAVAEGPDIEDDWHNFEALNLPRPGAVPTDIALAPDGAVWFIQFRGNSIGRLKDGEFAEFPVTVENAGLTGLAVAHDGAVWFGMLRAGSLGRLRNDELTTFKLPRDDARPYSVTVDRDGNVWYADIRGYVGMLPARDARQ